MCMDETEYFDELYVVMVEEEWNGIYGIKEGVGQFFIFANVMYGNQVERIPNLYLFNLWFSICNSSVKWKENSLQWRDFEYSYV